MTRPIERSKYALPGTLPGPLSKAINEAAQVISHRLFRAEQLRLRTAAAEMLKAGKTPEDVQRWLIAEAHLSAG